MKLSKAKPCGSCAALSLRATEAESAAQDARVDLAKARREMLSLERRLWAVENALYVATEGAARENTREAIQAALNRKPLTIQWGGKEWKITE